MMKHYKSTKCILFVCILLAMNCGCTVSECQTTTNVSSIADESSNGCEFEEKTSLEKTHFATHAPLYCPPCKQIHCYKSKTRRLRCKGGWTLGICGCCKVCAKLEGEECGGQHNYLGKCDQGLVCQPKEPRIISFIRNGVKSIYKVEKGICVIGVVRTYSPKEICKPKCQPEYCLKNPRAICSANENTEKFQECQGFCQHTSCRACKFQEMHKQCPTCAKDDFKCIRDFGRCIRKDVCKAKDYPCGNHHLNRKSTGRFQCQVPTC